MNNNKMYSLEIVNKAVSATAEGFTLPQKGKLEEHIKELPEEIQTLVIASILAGHETINAQMKKMISKAPEIEKKLKEIENPTEEDVNRFFKEIFEAGK